MTSNTPKKKSKKQQIIDRLSSKSGATIERLQTMTGWQQHTVRGTLSTLRKSGFEITTEKRPDKPTLYRIKGASDQVAEQGAPSITTQAAS